MTMDWKDQRHKKGIEIMRTYASNGTKLVNMIVGMKLFDLIFCIDHNYYKIW